MADYDIYFFCNDCNDIHPMGIKIPLAFGPRQKESVGFLYAGKELPPMIAELIDSQILCPKEGEPFIQRDLNQIYLVPI